MKNPRITPDVIKVVFDDEVISILPKDENIKKGVAQFLNKEKNREAHLRPEVREANRQRSMDMAKDPEVIAKRKAAREDPIKKAAREDPIKKAAMIQKNREAHSTPEMKEIARQRGLRLAKDPEVIAKRKAAREDPIKKAAREDPIKKAATSAKIRETKLASRVVCPYCKSLVLLNVFSRCHGPKCKEYKGKKNAKVKTR